MSEPITIGVFCGGKSGTLDAYASAARELGTAFAASGYRLVYGGGGNGIMGEISDAVMAGGAGGKGEVIGVMPNFLRQYEVENKNVSRFIYTETMHERKKIMSDYASAFVFLPGGVGTLDELFDLLALHSLKQHDKPMILLNVENYWSRLWDLLGHIKDSGFLHGSHPQLQMVDKVEDVMRILKNSLSDRQADG